MAYKSFRSLTPRKQSSLVTQLYKLINYYGDIFCSRERTYIKSLTQSDNAVYWLEDDEHKVIALAILDPNYVFNASGLSVKALGYTISKRAGQMDRILSHIWSDNYDCSIALLCRKTLARVFDLEELKLVEISPFELQTYWSELSTQTTEYFNVSRETLAEGMARKDYHMYLKLTEEDSKKLQQTNSELHNFLMSKTVSIQNQAVAL